MITVASRIADYAVRFVDASELAQRIEAAENHCLVIDERVWALHRGGCLRFLDEAAVIVQQAQEDEKTLRSAERLYDALIARSAKRNLTLVSIGGGIVQDITGFVASTLYRGVRWMYVPSTLLAQADSCIGGKTSLNHASFKNLVGTFYPPSDILIHSEFLGTLPDLYYFSGLGEVVKLQLLAEHADISASARLVERMAAREPQAVREGVRRSLEIKQTFITEDEFDRGRRKYLNFGHCFGHALESTSGFEIPHGQAVVLGMILANQVATQRGVMSPEMEERLRRLLFIPVVRVTVRADFLRADAIISGMKADKKRTGAGLALVMLDDHLRPAVVEDLGEGEVRRALADLPGLLKTSV